MLAVRVVPGQPLCTVRSAGAEDVDRAVLSAKAALQTWSRLSGMERGKILRQTAIVIRVGGSRGKSRGAGSMTREEPNP